MSRRLNTKRTLAVRLRQLYEDDTGLFHPQFPVKQGTATKEEIVALRDLTSDLCSEENEGRVPILLHSLCGTPKETAEMWSEFQFKPR